jgi:hypothetical protein
LTGLAIDEAEVMLRRLVRHITNDLNSGVLKPNAGDYIHHMIRVQWGSSGIVSGFHRTQLLIRLGLKNTRMYQDRMYILLKKE